MARTRHISTTKLLFFALIVSGFFAFGVGSAEAEDLYVRPASQGEYGTEDGSDYSNAFDGWADIVWDTDQAGDVGEVGPGDTLYVCGTHIYADDFSYGQNLIGADGTSGNDITINGACPGDSGAIIGSRLLETTDGWTDNGDGTWQKSWGWSTAYVWEGEIGESDEKLLNVAATTTDCINTDGSFYWDDPNNILYVNPYGDTLRKIWANWVYGLDLDGRDYITVSNLTLRGGSGNDGVLRINKTDSSASSNITIDTVDIAMGYYTGIYWQDDEDLTNLTITNSTIHHVPTGTYWIQSSGGHLETVTITNNEVYSGEDLAGIYGATRSDRHALGGQAANNVTVTDNYIHDWAGDGILAYSGTTQPAQNWTIARNRIINLNDDNNAYYHYAIYKGGSNRADFGDVQSGWVIKNNIVHNCGGDVADGEGIGLRIKSIVPSVSGDMPQVYNNTISDCNFGLGLVYISGGVYDHDIDFRNNNIYSSKTGGYHLNIGMDMNLIVSTSSVFANNNYYPNTSGSDNQFKWRNQAAGDFADFISKASSDGVTAGTNSTNADPSFTNYATDDFTLQPLSPAIDAGTDVSLTTDYAGNSIYGTPDIGAYEYQPPYTVGTDNIPTTGSVRIYSDGKYRLATATSTATTASFSVTPPSGSWLATTTQYLDLSISTWSTTTKEWVATSTAGTFSTLATSTLYTIGDLDPLGYYEFSLDAATSTAITGSTCTNSVCQADASGNLTFTYTGGYSTHTFTLSQDTTAPTAFTLSTPTDNTTNSELTPTFSWETSTDTQSGLSHYTLYVDATLHTDSITTTSTTASIETLSCGAHTWYVIAHDNDGNTTQSTDTFTYTTPCTGTSGGSTPPATTLPTQAEPATTTPTTSTPTTPVEATPPTEPTAHLPTGQAGGTSPSHTFTTYLKRGDRGVAVSQLQETLRSLGFFTYPTITDYFGTITESAVQAFQAAHGIETTGTVGPQTRAALNGIPTTTPQTPSTTPLPSTATFTYGLSYGMTDPLIKTLQQLLNQDPDTLVAEQGYGSPGNETTYFGEATLHAVRRFQTKHTITTPDDTAYGYVGPKTRAVLNAL